MTEQPGPTQPPASPPPGAPAPGEEVPPSAPPPPPAQYAPSVPSAGPAVAELAIKRSFWRCALASVASFGVYTFWWFYVYRKRVSAELGKTDDAALHTVGLLVPFLNYYLIYLLWKDISDARVRLGLSQIPAVAYVIGAIFIYPVFYGIVNAQLNEYWDRRTGGQATDAPWTTGERLATFVPLVLFGGFILLVIVLAIVLPGSS
jgi:hypothetical protein